jgi:predicted MFS family arabinose efflux permease
MNHHSPHSNEASSRRRRTGLWSVVFAFLSVMAFSTVPTPLYSIYQTRDGFSTFLVTVVFAAYAVGVVLALFFGGHVSDWLGRRRVLVPAVLTSVVSALVFLLWRGLFGLLLGRVLSGLAVGIVTATATAYVGELHLGARPGASPRASQAVASTANLGGLGLGAVAAGILAQTVTAPLTVPFLLFGGVLAIAGLAVAFAPETVNRPRTRPRYHPQRVAVPASARGQFFGAAVGGFVSFAAFGLFTSLAPSFIAGTLHQTSHIIAGLPAFVAFTAAAVAQLATARWELRRLLSVGMLGLSAGIALVVAATWLPSLAVFLIGGLTAGAGAGLLFKGGILTASGLAAPQRRAEVLAGFFLAAYVGVSVPVLGLGILEQFIAPNAALLAFAGLLLGGIGAAARSLLVDAGRGRTRQPIRAT